MRNLLRVGVLCASLLAAVLAQAEPRNVILMVGDGMGPDVVAAAAAYRFGPAAAALGGAQKLAMETLARRCCVTTFSTGGKGYDFTWRGGDREYPKGGCTDSAAAATALATGVKTYDHAIAVDPQRQPLVTILELAQQRGLKTGVVTTVPFPHATPAAFAAHCEARDRLPEIAHDMLFGVQPDLVMGAGHPGSEGTPTFDQIRAEDWAAIRDGKTPYRLVQTREEFRALATAPPATGKVLGAFLAHGSLALRKADGAGADPKLPTLAEMTRGALAFLANPRGFVLMVEGGAIDWANHANDLNGSIGETLGFDEAVAAVLEWIAAHGGWSQNLLLITADHDTGYLHDVQATAAGQLPKAAWGTTGPHSGHTNRLVPLFFQGVGSERVEIFTLKAQDFERGAVDVIDNTAIYWVMRNVLPPAPLPAGP